METITIYDVISHKTICLAEETELKAFLKSINVRIDSFKSFLKNIKTKQLKHRYILPINKPNIFTVIDSTTGIEYDCITGNTICLHLGVPPDGRFLEAICRIKTLRCYASMIDGRPFTLKGGKILKTEPDIELYDSFTGETIYLKHGKMKEKCRELKIDYLSLFSLFYGKTKAISSRYILPKNKNKIFTVIDLDTGKEYSCIDNYSLFLQLNTPWNQNESSGLAATKSKKQKFACIGGRVFYIKGHEGNLLSGRIRKLKNHSSVIMSLIEKQNKQRKIKDLVLNRILKAISQQTENKSKKRYKTNKYLGCSIEFYTGYLEALFLPGMDWKNRGKARGMWNIDHVKPCSSFNLESDEECFKCFHYTNTRPLWSEENLVKNDKIFEDVINEHRQKLKLNNYL